MFQIGGITLQQVKSSNVRVGVKVGASFPSKFLASPGCESIGLYVGSENVLQMQNTKKNNNQVCDTLASLDVDRLLDDQVIDLNYSTTETPVHSENEQYLY